MTLTKKELKNITLNINLFKLREYSNDDIVGYAEVKIDDNIYHKEPIYAQKIETDKNLSWWQKLRRWIFNG